MSSFQIKMVDDFCNLRCTYCRNREFDQFTPVVMSHETLRQLLAFLNSSPFRRVRVQWHGGEPLLAGKPFFRQIIEEEAAYPEKEWMNGVQTNATLIDDEWASFFSEHSFSVGVSIDGSQRTHDIDRINVGGKGTYRKVMRGVDILRQHDIHPGVICTVTKKTVDSGEEMFMSLVEQGFTSISFNAFYNTASNASYDEYGLTDETWLQFLIDVFEAWERLDRPDVQVREIDGILAWTQGKSFNSCVFRGMCHQWFAIGHDGSIYPCERLGKTPMFGNILLTGTIEELEQSETFLEWKSSIQRVPEKCAGCDLFSLCHNGCTSHRQAELGEIPLYVFCESRIRFFQYLQEQVGGAPHASS